MIVTLPWPPTTLSPNSRAHWAAKRPRREEVPAGLRIRCGRRPGRCQPAGERHHNRDLPPTERAAEDADNLLASIKSGIDGICDALAINDRQFWQITVRFGEVAKGGAVVVEIA